VRERLARRHRVAELPEGRGLRPVHALARRARLPDPTFQASPGGFGVEFKVGPPMGIDPKSPQFQAAGRDCAKLTGFAGP